MAKFSNYGIDWNGKQPGKKFYEISCKLLNNSTGGLLERFIKLIPALEALGMSINTPSINWSFVELKRKFPGFDVEDGRINITTASKENVLEYFQRFSQNQVISPGIICLARHMAAGGSAKQVASSLRKVGFRYSQVGMEVIVGKGLLFIERILLSNGKDFKKTDDEIFRSLSELNTKQDIRFLMTTIAQEIAQNKNN